MAQTWFGCFDPAVLSAIGCHTTLKANPGPLDLLVFLADKLAWDQPGGPPYAAAVQAAVGLPVYDFYTMLCHAHAAMTRTAF